MSILASQPPPMVHFPRYGVSFSDPDNLRAAPRQSGQAAAAPSVQGRIPVGHGQQDAGQVYQNQWRPSNKEPRTITLSGTQPRASQQTIELHPRHRGTAGASGFTTSRSQDGLSYTIERNRPAQLPTFDPAAAAPRRTPAAAQPPSKVDRLKELAGKTYHQAAEKVKAGVTKFDEHADTFYENHVEGHQKRHAHRYDEDGLYIRNKRRHIPGISKPTAMDRVKSVGVSLRETAKDIASPGRKDSYYWREVVNGGLHPVAKKLLAPFENQRVAATAANARKGFGKFMKKVAARL